MIYGGSTEHLGFAIVCEKMGIAKTVLVVYLSENIPLTIDDTQWKNSQIYPTEKMQKNWKPC